MTTECSELIVRRLDPYNAETPLNFQTGVETPVEEFYVRSHFAVPETWDHLVVDGAVDKRVSLGLNEIRAMDQRTILATMECAGNGRAFLSPPTPGVQWELGAVGTAQWTGTPLRNILSLAGVAPAAVEILFEGEDSGTPEGHDRAIAYERSLTVEEAQSEDVLVCWSMNGKALTTAHGAPLRLVVPGWYGMASVKWLKRVSALTEPFQGFYQTTDYVIERPQGSEPCREMMPRAIITHPHDGDEICADDHVTIRGYAWAGSRQVESVDVSIDGGVEWGPANVRSAASKFAWAQWEYEWGKPPVGPATILARAKTATDIQPLEAVWTKSGYANNASRGIEITIRE